MLDKLKELLARTTPGAVADDVDDERALRVATAALLVEMARADFSEDTVEHEEILRVLRRHFALDIDSAKALLEQAGERAEQSVSLHEFTHLLHGQLSNEDKHRIVEMLWRVALADAELDKHEDHLVRKISELLYVSHTDLMRLKHRVLGELDAGD